MTETHYINRKEMTSTEILDELHHGNRVIIEITLLGKTMRMAIREQNGTYYCDTPVKLFTYQTDRELQVCLERYQLAQSGTEERASDELQSAV